MNPITLPALSLAFRISGALLCLPSLAVLAMYAAKLVSVGMVASSGGTDFGSNPDAILLLLSGMVKLFTGLAWLVDRLFDLLALAAAVGLVLGLVLWCTGTGLRRGAAWARFSAGLLLALLLLVAVLLALSQVGGGRVLMLVLAAASGMALQVSWRGAPPVPA